MSRRPNWKSIRPSALLLIAMTAGLNLAQAGIVQPTDTLPPPTGVYSLPLICIATVCLENATVSGFNNTSDVFSGGNELVTSTATFSADVYQDNSGNPGAFLAPLSAGGTMDFTYFDRGPSTPLGTFNAQITALDFAGTFLGHPFEIEQNPSQASTGITTINEVPGITPMYQVTSFFDVFLDVSLNGGPFVPGPQRQANLSGTPEPLSGWCMLAGLASLVGLRLRRIAAAH
jgi:hypothetical protein